MVMTFCVVFISLFILISGLLAAARFHRHARVADGAADVRHPTGDG